MKSKYLDVFKAFLIYSPTLIVLPQTLIYIIIAVIGGFYFISDLKNNKIFKQDLILFLFVILSIVVYFLLDPVAETKSRSLNDFIPYTIFLLTTIFFARHLNNKVLAFIFYFVCFEVLIGIVEYVIGIPYIIEPSLTSEIEFGDSVLLYYNRVYGLSQGVSIFGYKVMIGILLLFYLKIKKYRLLLLVLLFIGLLVTFNRTAIIGSVFFLLIYLIYIFRKIEISYKIFIVFFSIALFYFIFLNFNIIENQFFRGQQGDLSGRGDIFPYYFNFIKDNILLGNNFHKMWGELYGKQYHAHNSYLQTLANMGVVFFVMLWIYIFTFFKKRNILYLLPILLYSTFQYGILWGVSFLDIIFFYILFNQIIKPKNENTINTSIF